MRTASILFFLLSPVLVVAAASAPPADAAAGVCGRISVFDTAPRSQDLYRAVLIDIDGRLPGPTNARTFRVEPGPHVLKIAEAIDTEQFTGIELKQRSSLRPRDPYKTLTIDVKPDTTYLLAARLVEERRRHILDKTYWEPVIYQEIAENCR